MICWPWMCLGSPLHPLHEATEICRGSIAAQMRQVHLRQMCTCSGSQLGCCLPTRSTSDVSCFKQLGKHVLCKATFTCSKDSKDIYIHRAFCRTHLVWTILEICRKEPSTVCHVLEKIPDCALHSSSKQKIAP